VSAPGLRLGIIKQPDGNALLRCTRADGSTTWQKQQGDHAAFFPLHDLTHYAVETELGFRRGFYGLIADGWDIADTTGKTARGALPNEAIEVEYLVSAFSAERAGGAIASAAEFNQLRRSRREKECRRHVNSRRTIWRGCERVSLSSR
jgi:uncharacterized C2H2 Zn-finger protein